MENASTKPKKGFFYYVEKGGNALPNPAILFGIFALTVLVLSLIGSWLGWQGQDPVTGETIHVNNLLSRDGLHRIILEAARNFTSFPPLGIVVVALLGLGVAESSGLIKTAINAMLAKAPAKWVTFIIIFAGLISNVASDLGYILIIPLAGVIFHSLGRNPLVGMAAAFAGVSGGFSANILISTQDPMLAGISTRAAELVQDPKIFGLYEVLPTANYYFMAASTFLIAIVCTIVTVKWVEPRLGPYSGDTPREEMTKPTAIESKGLKRAGWVFLGFFALIAAGLIPENGILRGVDGSILGSPVLRGFITLLFLMCASAGIVYGYTVGKFKKADDVITGMNDNIKTLASYFVLVFFAAQFIAYFDWSKLGTLLAIKGANALEGFGADAGGSVFTGLIPLLLLFILFTSFMNLFMGSASAKWAIVGPIFVPMFMLLGYSPELAQAAYRVGDSVTNIITPVLPYFALVIVYFQKYVKQSGIGTIMATMLPYSIALFISWTVLLIIWVLLVLPLGPGVSMFYELPTPLQP